MTTFVVFNKADAPPDAVTAMIAGWRCQLAQDVCPVYGPASTVRQGDLTEEASLTDDEVGFSIFKNPDVPDAGGYHDEDPQGRPYCRIFTDPYLANGGTWTSGANSVSCAGSHEIIEALGDMNANGWWLMPDGRFTAQELCDAVEDQSYQREGVAVSNFLFPDWSRAGNQSRRYDFLQQLSAPFTLSSGGYWLVTDGAGNVTTEWGTRFPDWKKSLKILHSKRLGMRCRVETIRMWRPEDFPLDPIQDRFKPRMLLQEAAKTGIPTIERAPTQGRSIVNVTGVKPVQTPITKVKVTNNSGQKLGKKVW